MSEQVKCDTCGRSLPLQGLVEWMTVDWHRATVDTTTLGQAPIMPADFCSFDCLIDFGMRKGRR